MTHFEDVNKTKVQEGRYGWELYYEDGELCSAKGVCDSFDKIEKYVDSGWLAETQETRWFMKFLGMLSRINFGFIGLEDRIMFEVDDV